MHAWYKLCILLSLADNQHARGKNVDYFHVPTAAEEKKKRHMSACGALDELEGLFTVLLSKPLWWETIVY